MVIRVLAVLALAVAACTLLDNDPPTNTCKLDSDCFKTETCNAQSHTCVPRADAGVDAP